MAATLEDILLAREARWKARLDLASRTRATVVSCTLVIPGANKNPAWAGGVFERLSRKLVQALDNAGMPIKVCENLHGDDGRCLLLAVDTPAKDVKKLCVSLEDGTNLGRLADFDVLCHYNGIMGRAELNLPSRQCLLCTAPAAECIRARRHSQAELEHTIRIIIENPSAKRCPGASRADLP